MITADEAQELHEAIGAAIETGDVRALPRAREIAALLVADTDKTRKREHEQRRAEA